MLGRAGHFPLFLRVCQFELKFHPGTQCRYTRTELLLAHHGQSVKLTHEITQETSSRGLSSNPLAQTRLIQPSSGLRPHGHKMVSQLLCHVLTPVSQLDGEGRRPKEKKKKRPLPPSPVLSRKGSPQAVP